MPHITIADHLPGIRGLAAFRPETGRSLYQLAAVFCMANRYVDGLATWAPDDPETYAKAGAFRAANGYLVPSLPVR